jgi:thiosulfate/3-mercaptopyruvate sulfurtransferase
MRPLPPIVVDTAWVRANPACVLADVRWTLGIGPQRAEFEAGHLPGAVFVDLDRHLAGPATEPTAGRHPLPTPVTFALVLSELGIDENTVVVAYDTTGGSTASRLVWMLRAIGHPAALLDGGLGAWDGELEVGVGAARPATKVSARQWPASLLVTANEVAAHLETSSAVVLDARSPERYRGDANPIDARLGHIPGARNAPWAANLVDGRFRPAIELRAMFGELGVTEQDAVVVSCGSGVTACADAIALELAGYHDIRVFIPSWSGWSADPTRSAATGAEPGRTKR